MKKTIRFNLFISMIFLLHAQLKYGGNENFYLDIGFQVNNSAEAKMTLGTKIRKHIRIGVGTEKTYFHSEQLWV